MTMSSAHGLDAKEAETIFILREVAAQFRNPVLMYSIGKDSSVLLHVSLKAFHPAPPPFTFLHIDTGWKFREMIRFRDEVAKRHRLKVVVHTNVEGRAQGINPFDHGSAYTDIMKTQALRQALEAGGYDCAIGGARRDEEISRAKERVFSFRSASHVWDPKNQRPELWNIYNGRIEKGESVRAFPLSNWTELDIWRYIAAEKVAIPSLYYAAMRPVVERDGLLIMVDDDRMPIGKDETVSQRMIRFRTLGCYPLTGAIESTASDPEAIIAEMAESRTSERAGRLIDKDANASMEKKKAEGYF